MDFNLIQQLYILLVYHSQIKQKTNKQTKAENNINILMNK